LPAPAVETAHCQRNWVGGGLDSDLCSLSRWWLFGHPFSFLFEQLQDALAFGLVGSRLQQFLVMLDILMMDEPLHNAPWFEGDAPVD
jgi:hypothetical protein